MNILLLFIVFDSTFRLTHSTPTSIQISFQIPSTVKKISLHLKMNNSRLILLLIFILEVRSAQEKIVLEVDATCFGCSGFISYIPYYYISQNSVLT